MTNFSFPKSDRELWGLRGLVKAFTEEYVTPVSVPADFQQPASRIEFNREGMLVVNSGVSFSFDQDGRKTRVRVSRPEDYVPDRFAGGSPFSIADRRPNLPDGGKATTYYDEYDRPVEAVVRDSRDKLVISAIRIYDTMGRVSEETLTMHVPSAFWPAALRPHLRVNNEIKERMNAGIGSRSVKFFYDSDRTIRTVKRARDEEVVVVTACNEHNDPEVEITTARAVVAGDTVTTLASYSEVRHSYQYDHARNWTEKTSECRTSPEGAFSAPMTIRRALEYF